MSSVRPTTALQTEDRLSSGELNWLLKELYAHIKSLKSQSHPKYKDAIIDEGQLRFAKNNKGYARTLNYFAVEKEYVTHNDEGPDASPIITKKRIVVLDVTKDTDDTKDENELNLPYLYSVAQLIRRNVAKQSQSKTKLVHKLTEESKTEIVETQKFEESFTEDDFVDLPPQFFVEESKIEDEEVEAFFKYETSKKSIIVMPVHQCGDIKVPVVSWSKAHVVLAVLDTGNNKIAVHDSKAGLPILNKIVNVPIPDIIYSDIFAGKSDFGYSGTIPHGIQLGDNECAYIVHNWIYSLLDTGDTSYFKLLNVTDDKVVNKKNYLENWRQIVKEIQQPLDEDYSHTEYPSDSEKDWGELAINPEPDEFQEEIELALCVTPTRESYSSAASRLFKLSTKLEITLVAADKKQDIQLSS